MKLQAVKKSKEKRIPEIDSVETKSEKTMNCALNFQINANLYNTIQNIIVSLHTSNDFTYVSSADFIRTSLDSYKEGMELTELDEKGAKVNTSIRLNQNLKDFYTNLPNRMRSKIIERAIRTFIKNMQ